MRWRMMTSYVSIWNSDLAISGLAQPPDSMTGRHTNWRNQNVSAICFDLAQPRGRATVARCTARYASLVPGDPGRGDPYAGAGPERTAGGG